MPLLMIFTRVPLLGWAKPTPVDPRYFRDLRRGQIVVSGAGPLSNFLLALLFTARPVRGGAGPAGAAPGEPARPVPAPSASSSTCCWPSSTSSRCPRSTARTSSSGRCRTGWATATWRSIAPYGGFILLALVMSGALFKVLSPVLDFVVGLLYSLVR